MEKRDGGTKRQRRFNRDAEGVEGVEKWGGGIPLPIQLGGLEERRELPQWGPGRSSGKFWFLGYFLCQKHDVYAAICLLYTSDAADE